MRRKLQKIVATVLVFLFFLEQTGFAQVAAQLDIASHLAGLRNSFVQDKFRPLHLRYLQYTPQDNNFHLLLDKGDTKNPTSTELETTTKELLNYFFVGLSLPNDAFWVNLRPDSPDNIIDPLVAQTEVGRILLDADLQLKKDTARMTSPETPEGKDYWNKLYAKAGELFGSENIAIPTLSRPWIVPDEIIVRESIDSAYIYKATLKVMLEQDYLKESTVYSFKDERLKALNEYSSQLIRETIIPKLTKGVNTSKRYASLRQVYYSLILAQWFKARQAGKDNPYSRRINSKNLSNLFAQTPYSVDTYFKAYKENFQKGEYNIKEPAYAPYGQVIRSYFSGGITVLPSDTSYAGALTSPIGEPSTTAPLIPTSLPIVTLRKGEVEAQVETGPAGELRQIKIGNPSASRQGLITRRHFLQALGMGGASAALGGNLLATEKDVNQQLKDQVDGWITHVLNKRYLFNLDFKNVSAKHVEYLTDRMINAKNDDVKQAGLKIIEEMNGIEGYTFNTEFRINVLLPQLRRLMKQNTEEKVFLNILQVFGRVCLHVFLRTIADAEKRKILKEIIPEANEYGNFFWKDATVQSIQLVARLMELIKDSDVVGDVMPILETALENRNDDIRRAATTLAAAVSEKMSGNNPLKRMFKTLSLRVNDVTAGTIPYSRVKTIYMDEEFHAKTDSLSLANQFSIARALDLNLARYNVPLNKDNLRSLLSFILKIRGKRASLPVINAQSTIIVGLHEDAEFNGQIIKDYLAQFIKLGPGESIDKRIKLRKGPDKKEQLRQDLKGAPADVLFWIDGHGGENHPLWFTDGEIGNQDSDRLRRPEAYSYQELAEDIIAYAQNHDRRASGFKIVVNSCISVTSLTKVLNALTKAMEDKKIIDLPSVIITAAEYNVTATTSSDGSGSTLFKALKKATTGAREVTVNDFFKSEDEVYKSQDTGFFFSLSKEELEEFWKTLGVEGVMKMDGFTSDFFMQIKRTQNKLNRYTLLTTKAPVLSGLMGRWNYESTEFNSQEKRLTIYQATRIPKDGVVEEEFLSNGENLPRTITLRTRELTEQERNRVNRLKAELGHETVEYHVLLRDEESIKHRIYGFGVDGIAFIREDILSEGDDEQVKEALDHEARELTDKEHDVIREEQYQGGLRELITRLSDGDKQGRGINVAAEEHAWGDMKLGYDGKGTSEEQTLSSGVKNGLDSIAEFPSVQENQPVPSPASRGDTLGGIDFRYLPIVTQAIGNLHSVLSSISLTRLRNVNISSEWQEIERLVNSGITPSTERIKEFVQAAAIRSDTDSDMSTVVSCIADIFRLEEECCEHSDPTLKDILIVLESGRNSQELREVFVGHKI
jgi:hypothetical protein